jgi:hypothetical protein
MTPAQYKSFITDPRMSRTARKRRVKNIFPTLCRLYEEQHPEDPRPLVIVLDTIRASWQPGMTYAMWVAVVRQKLQLDLVEDNVRLRAHVVKVKRPSIGAPGVDVTEEGEDRASAAPMRNA